MSERIKHMALAIGAALVAWIVRVFASIVVVLPIAWLLHHALPNGATVAAMIERIMSAHIADAFVFFGVFYMLWEPRRQE